MRAATLMTLIVVTGIFFVGATKNRNFSQFVKHRTKLREIRGFKPEYISTAIGFGKREDTRKFNRRENTLSTLFQTFYPRGVPVEWLLREMKTNPVFVEKLTQLIKEERNSNDLLSIMDHSEPERTFSLL